MKHTSVVPQRMLKNTKQNKTVCHQFHVGNFPQDKKSFGNVVPMPPLPFPCATPGAPCPANTILGFLSNHVTEVSSKVPVHQGLNLDFHLVMAENRVLPSDRSHSPYSAASPSLRLLSQFSTQQLLTVG